MKRIYDFSRSPAKRNYTIADLQALKGTGKKLSMSNPANAKELRACLDAGIDLLVVWESQIEEVRQIAPHHFAGVGRIEAGRLVFIVNHRQVRLGVAEPAFDFHFVFVRRLGRVAERTRLTTRVLKCLLYPPDRFR